MEQARRTKNSGVDVDEWARTSMMSRSEPMKLSGALVEQGGASVKYWRGVKKGSVTMNESMIRVEE